MGHSTVGWSWFILAENEDVSENWFLLIFYVCVCVYVCLCVCLYMFWTSQRSVLVLDSARSVEQLLRHGSEVEKVEDLTCIMLVLPSLHSDVENGGVWGSWSVSVGTFRSGACSWESSPHCQPQRGVFLGRKQPHQSAAMGG